MRWTSHVLPFHPDLEHFCFINGTTEKSYEKCKMTIIKSNILAMSAYLPPLDGRDANAHVLLDFNERTIPVAEPIKKALEEFIASDKLQQYPAYGNIVNRLAEYAGVTPEQLMITNGSDQGIDLIFRAVAKPNAEAIIPGPSFAMYTQCAQVESMTLIQPQYQQAQGYPLKDVIAAINDNTAIIVASSPNNPCGTPISNDEIIRLSQAAPHAAILVDECYFEYTKTTILPQLNDLPNVFVTRTFSKTWGIPSLRFGYLIAAPEYVNALCNIRGPYDINQLAVVAANAALDYADEINVYVEEVMDKAKPLLENWLSKNNINFWPSTANYLWVFPEQAEGLNKFLQNSGVLVRPKAYRQQLGLRMTIGTLEQTNRLITLCDNFLSKN